MVINCIQRDGLFFFISTISSLSFNVTFTISPFLTPLPIISQEEIDKIRNGNNQDNLNYGVFSK